MNDSSATSNRTITFILCFLGAMAEGYDLQAGGVVLAKLVAAFQLTPEQRTWIPTANTIGLLIGALIGGWMADRIGRKKVLQTSMLIFGVFMVATTYAWDAQSLIAMRFLVGLGLGGAMPNIISLLAESGGAGQQNAKGMISRVTGLAAAIPFGGFLCVVLALTIGGGFDWKTIVMVGGVVPIVIGLLMIPLLGESQVYLNHKSSQSARGQTAPVGAGEALFGGGRGLSTLLIWVAGICTLIVLYLLLGWLPVLMTGRGLTPVQATWVASMFALGGAIGAVGLGYLMRLGHKLVVTVTYGLMAVGVYMLATVGNQFNIAMIATLIVGIFVIGGQYLLYGLSPTYYPTAVRGTGVGAAVSIGRVGAVLGPWLAGNLLAGGSTSAEVIMAILPAVAVAFVAAFWLVTRPHSADGK